MMTLDEAIIHAENVVWSNDREADRCFRHGGSVYDEKAKNCKACAEEHRQLAEWLKELKERKSKCKWIKYDCRTVCPKNHDIDNPYWRIPENRMDTLKYCPYCGKEIEVSE